MARTKTVAVISCYRPGGQFAANVVLAASECDEVVIVDDGSGPEWAALLSDLGSRVGVTVLVHAENLGIAKALNDGVDRAIDRNASHILFLDQDSALPEGFVTSEHALLDAASAAGLPVGVVAPWLINGYASKKLSVVVKGFLVRDEPIQSGQLMPLSTWQTVGRFREGFFIDGVDTDYFLRLRDHGLMAVFVPTLDLPHSLGGAVQATMLGKTLRVHGRPLTVRVHPPLRTYYIYRNGVRLALERLRGNPRFVAGWTVGMAKRAVISLGLGPRKSEQLRAIWLGLFDGLRGRSGKAARQFSPSLGARTE